MYYESIYMYGRTSVSQTRQTSFRPKTQGYGLIISAFSIMQIQFWNEFI